MHHVPLEFVKKKVIGGENFHRAGSAAGDLNNDGWLDIYLTNGESNPNALYRNLRNGTFEDVAASAGVDLMVRTGQVTSGDIDNDGDIDAYFPNADQADRLVRYDLKETGQAIFTFDRSDQQDG